MIILINLKTNNWTFTQNLYFGTVSYLLFVLEYKKLSPENASYVICRQLSHKTSVPYTVKITVLWNNRLTWEQKQIQALSHFYPLWALSYHATIGRTQSRDRTRRSWAPENALKNIGVNWSSHVSGTSTVRYTISRLDFFHFCSYEKSKHYFIDESDIENHMRKSILSETILGGPGWRSDRVKRTMCWTNSACHNAKVRTDWMTMNGIRGNGWTWNSSRRFFPLLNQSFIAPIQTCRSCRSSGVLQNKRIWNEIECGLKLGKNKEEYTDGEWEIGKITRMRWQGPTCVLNQGCYGEWNLSKFTTQSTVSCYLVLLSRYRTIF